jgi:hypothetical protein
MRKLPPAIGADCFLGKGHIAGHKMLQERVAAWLWASEKARDLHADRSKAYPCEFHKTKSRPAPVESAGGSSKVLSLWIEFRTTPSGRS